MGATSGVVGSHQAMAVLLAVLDRQESWGTAHVDDGLRGRMEPVRLPRDPECPNHEGPLPIAASYQGKATQTSAADLDASLGPIAGLCLRYALVVALACANGHREEVLRPLAALASEVLPCPECGEAPREAEYGDGKGSGPDGGGGDLASVAPRRIEIESLDGRVFRTNVQGNTGVSALAGQFVRQHVHGDRTSSRRERAVVDLERDGEWRRLNGNATVHAAGVEDGDRLRIHSDAVAGAMNPLRREAALNDVQQQLEELAARDERIELRPNLPRAADRYEITLRCGGWGPPESSVDSPYRTQQQEVVLEYPADFPAAPPQVWWRSPIFHPNVRPKDGYVCLGAFQESFTPLFGPVALVLMLIELSEYRNYELDGVLNREAAMWAQLRPELIAGHGGWPFQPTLKEERDDEEPTLEFEEHGTGVGLRRRRR
ncbi:MAG: hypothetical protein GY856_01305 [bacterium]|nr:hypothetical protein [bacterium]